VGFLLEKEILTWQRKLLENYYYFLKLFQ
jgi:hypothetical protein